MYSFTNIFPYIIKSNFCIFFFLFGLFLFVCWVGVCCVCLAMASFSRTIVCKTTHRTSFSVCCAWAHIFSHIFSSLRFRCLSGLMIPSFFIVFFRDIFFFLLLHYRNICILRDVIWQGQILHPRNKTENIYIMLGVLCCA